MLTLFATCPRGLEYLLVDELRDLGASDVREALAGVHFHGDLALAYRAASRTRLASRVLLQMVEGAVDSAEQLYELIQSVEWSRQMTVDQTFAVEANVRRHRAFRDQRFAGLKVKDAICDQFRSRCSRRPDVDRNAPDLRVYCFITGGRASAGIDLLGYPLHQRGYRASQGAAPMKENLASAVIMRSGWLARPESPLLDPFCGGGTLLIEAAMAALNMPPSTLWAADIELSWQGHDAELWRQNLQQIADDAATARAGLTGPLLGSDREPGAVAAARRHAAALGLGDHFDWRIVPLDRWRPPKNSPAGHVVANPPYGRRLGDGEAVFDLYRQLGQQLTGEFGGWHASVLTEDADLCRGMDLSPHKSYSLFNGGVACRLLLFRVPEQKRELSDGATMVANRIAKNRKRLKNYLRNNEVECYRVYDRDIPEYAAAVDVYGDWVNIQEYAPPATVPAALAQRRLLELAQGAEQALEIATRQVVVHRRQRQRGSSQYERRAHTEHFFTVTEGGLKFEVNLNDYLDTGLFLDHRETRALVREWSKGLQVLNLFCYTGSFTVYAAAGGATHTCSVDWSRTYLDWARRNLAANGLDSSDHRLIRDDCRDFLRQHAQQFDLIICDPPTFSNSKRSPQTFDVQRDHVELLELCAPRLASGGRVLLSTNAQRFKLDEPALASWRVDPLNTIPPDFSRRRPHRCWILSRAN